MFVYQWKTLIFTKNNHNVAREIQKAEHLYLRQEITLQISYITRII